MRYLYENHEDFSVLPTYFVIYGPVGTSVTNVFENIRPGMQLDPTRVCNFITFYRNANSHLIFIY